MYHAVRVDVIEALCDVDQLKNLRRRAGEAQKEAHKSDPIPVRVRFDVSHQVSSRHPLRRNLGRVDSRTYEWDDVGMRHSFPHQSFPEKHLFGPSEKMDNWEQ